MAKKSPARPKTFAELVAEPTWSETDAGREEHAPVPGGVNRSGEFFDPAGLKLVLREADVSLSNAQYAVDHGALVVAEACGCGGEPGGCVPVWLNADALRELQGGPAPQFRSKRAEATWIDVWGNDAHEVVYTHGDVWWAGKIIGTTI